MTLFKILLILKNLAEGFFSWCVTRNLGDDTYGVLGPNLNTPPVANTCFWVGRIAAKVDNAGNINVGVHICLIYLVVENLFAITVSSQRFPKQKKNRFISSMTTPLAKLMY